jgi:hypothetical protein
MYIMCLHGWGPSDNTKWMADSAAFGEVTHAGAMGNALGDALGGTGDMEMSSAEE